MPSRPRSPQSILVGVVVFCAVAPVSEGTHECLKKKINEATSCPLGLQVSDEDTISLLQMPGFQYNAGGIRPQVQDLRRSAYAMPADTSARGNMVQNQQQYPQELNGMLAQMQSLSSQRVGAPRDRSLLQLEDARMEPNRKEYPYVATYPRSEASLAGQSLMQLGDAYIQQNPAQAHVHFGITDTVNSPTAAGFGSTNAAEVPLMPDPQAETGTFSVALSSASSRQSQEAARSESDVLRSELQTAFQQRDRAFNLLEESMAAFDALSSQRDKLLHEAAGLTEEGEDDEVDEENGSDEDSQEMDLPEQNGRIGKGAVRRRPGRFKGSSEMACKGPAWLLLNILAMSALQA